MQADQIKSSVGGAADSAGSAAEITLVDLVLILWRKRVVALLAACVPLVAVVVHLLLASPVYRATRYIQAPLEQDIAALNTRHQGAVTYTVADVYTVFLNYLHSQDLRRRFFQQQNLLEYYGGTSFEDAFRSQFDKALTVELAQTDAARSQFDKALTVAPPKTAAAGFTRVSFESGDPQRTAELLNLYIEQVRAFTVHELIDEVIRNVQERSKWLRAQIAGEHKKFKDRTSDAIRNFEEALRIARKLGIKQPADFARSSGGSSPGGSSPDASQVPLYFRGSAALEAELEELRVRRADDRFITGMRDLQEELAWLESIKIQPEMLRVLRIDQPAIASKQPARPNRQMVIVVGIMLSGVFALAAACAAHFISVFRRELRQKIA